MRNKNKIINLISLILNKFNYIKIKQKQKFVFKK